MSEIDYRSLLIKYIEHVVDSEGTDFLNDWRQTDGFTDLQWAELRKLSEMNDE